MSASSLRRALAAAAVAASVVFTATACGTQPETIRSYNPSQGVNLDQGTAKLRNVVVVSQGTGGYLAGGINSSVADAIVGGSATLLNPDGSEAGPVQLNSAGKIDVPANKLVELQQSGIGVDGTLKPGQTVRLLLNFEHAGLASAVVPVLSSQHPDYVNVTPKAASRSSSSTPSASPSK